MIGDASSAMTLVHWLTRRGCQPLCEDGVPLRPQDVHHRAQIGAVRKFLRARPNIASAVRRLVRRLGEIQPEPSHLLQPRDTGTRFRNSPLS